MTSAANVLALYGLDARGALPTGDLTPPHRYYLSIRRAVTADAGALTLLWRGQARARRVIDRRWTNARCRQRRGPHRDVALDMTLRWLLGAAEWMAAAALHPVDERVRRAVADLVAAMAWASDRTVRHGAWLHFRGMVRRRAARIAKQMNAPPHRRFARIPRR